MDLEEQSRGQRPLAHTMRKSQTTQSDFCVPDLSWPEGSLMNLLSGG